MHKPSGLVLCGGESLRMGQEKHLIRYHDEPQWLHIARMLSPVCSQVTISCRGSQADGIRKRIMESALPFTVLVDSPMFAGHGPISGVRTVFEENPGPWLVVGCDYPALVPADFDQLLRSRNGGEAVCFNHDEIDEPLVAVYESIFASILKASFSKGEYSLRRILGIARVSRLKKPSHLRSVDAPMKS